MDQNPNDAVRPVQPNIGRYVGCGIAVLAVVVVAGVLFSSIAKVREPANRARSSSNIRQIAIAIHNYESNHGRFPTVCDHGLDSPTGFGVCSLHFQILPYIDGNAIHALHQLDQPQTYYGAAGAAQTVYRAYMSPSDHTAPDGAKKDVAVTVPGAQRPFATVFTGTYATTSYPVNGLIFVHDAEGKPPSNKTITDGVANTIMVAERFQLCKTASDSVPTLWGMGAFSATTASFALAAPTGPHPHTAAMPLRQFVPPVPMPPGDWLTFQVNPKSGKCDPTVMQTPHKSGMLVALGDGSGRTINASITAQTFWAAVTPAGKETLDPNW